MQMTATGTIPYDVPFPINGIDQSMPRSKQANLTATEILNCCGFPPFSDREGGGKTEGSRRAWNQQFTSAVGNNRVLGMSSLVVATGAASATPDGTDRLYPFAEDTPIPLSPQCWFIDGDTPESTLYGSLSETPADYDTTFVRCVPSNNPVTPNTCELTVSLTAPVTVPSNTASVVFTFVFKSAAPPGHVDGPETSCASDIDVDLLVSGVVVVDFVEVDAQGSNGAWITVNRTLAPEQIAAITAADPAWTHLQARIRCHTFGICLLEQFDISQVEVTINDGTTGPNNPTGFTGKILVMNRGRCRVGILPTDMGTETLPDEEVSDPADTAMVQDSPSISAFLGKWYCVDGVASKIITPSETTTGTGSEPTVTDWVATGGGEFPDNCRLTCVYSGRIVLARQEGPTPNASIWYMSRVLDPLDWAFALDTAERPAETAAVAGTNEYLGQPDDGIVALIPSGDDYLIFGGSKTMWIMEGDPGRGGSVVNLSRQTGIIGPRAWCFDETGALWFLGSSGLYRYTRGGGLQNVSGRKVYRLLDRINGDLTFIQLGYNAFRKEIMIFLTPQNAPSTATAQRYSYTVFQDNYATHLRYDTVRGAFFFRTFPWDPMGPWSVLEIQGSADDDRTYLLGGLDGFVRRPFEGGYIAGAQRYGTADDMARTGTAPTAAGTPSGKNFPITSSFRSAPIEWPGGVYEIRAMEIQATGTDNNLPLGLPLGSVRWRVMDDDSPSKVTEKDVDLSAVNGTWFDDGYGFQSPVGMSVSNGALQVVVSQPNNNTQSWALDRITLFVKKAGRRR